MFLSGGPRDDVVLPPIATGSQKGSSSKTGFGTGCPWVVDPAHLWQTTSSSDDSDNGNNGKNGCSWVDQRRWSASSGPKACDTGLLLVSFFFHTLKQDVNRSLLHISSDCEGSRRNGMT